MNNGDQPLLPVKPVSVETAERPSFVIRGLRYYILVLSTLCCALPLSSHSGFTFAVACNNEPGMNRSGVYNSNPSNSPILYFAGLDESLSFASYSLGNILMLPFIHMIKCVSMRTQVTTGAVLSAILTLIFPFVYDLYPRAAMFTKLLQGMCAAPTIPLLGHVGAFWSQKRDMGLFIGTLTCFSQAAILFTMSASGITCEMGGWRPIFYLHGSVMLVVAVVWCIFFRDLPCDHPWLSNEEYLLINSNRPRCEKSEEASKRQFFQSKGVWGVLIAAIGNYNGISPLIVFCSLIMRKAIGITELQISFYLSISFVCQTVFKVLSGVLSDKVTSVSEKSKLWFFNSISCGLSGALMIGTAFLPYYDKILCSIMLSVTQAIIGFNSAGFNKAAILVSGRQSSYMMTLIGIITSVSTIIEPFIVKMVAPQHTWEQWFPLFVVHGSILVLTNFIFCLMTDGKNFAESKTTSNIGKSY